MDLRLVVAGGVIVLALVAMSVYGAVTLPPGSLVPVHHGPGGYNNWRPKKFALIAWPAGGVVVYAVLLAATGTASSSGKATPAVIAPVAMLVLAVSSYFLLRPQGRAPGELSRSAWRKLMRGPVFRIEFA